MQNNRSKVNRTCRALRRRKSKAVKADAGHKVAAHGRYKSRNRPIRILDALVQQRTRELTLVNERLKRSMVRCQRLDGRLRESEELFRSIFEHANAGMNTLTLEGRYLQVNPAFCTFVGYSRVELQQLTVFDLTHPEDLLATRERFDAIRDGKYESFDYEKRFICKDGKVVWGHVTSAWMFDDRRQPLYGIGLVQDISDRKETETELKKALLSARQARAKIACILKSVGDGLIVTDTRKRISLMNPSAENLLGVALERVINQPVSGRYVTAVFPNALVGALASGENDRSFEFEMPGNEGKRPLIVQARMSVIRDQAQRPSGIITTLRDVSREREVDLMKTQFITTAAHELRTPLTSIQGFSEVLLSRSDLEGRQQCSMLEVIHEQAEYLGRIVNDLLDLARIESGIGFTLQKTPCNLLRLVRQTTEHFSWQHENHQFEIDLAIEGATVFGDPAKLRQLLENILSNAVKYSPDGGMVRISGQCQENIFQLSVADHGIGMSSDQLQRMFDRFYRADNSNSAIEGVGLGINIAQEIIKAHGGRIWVESRLGEGTIVHFSLPTEG